MGQKKGCDESFQVRAKEPLGTDSHRTVSKNSSGSQLLIGHKKCFVLLCPIGEQFLLSSFREFLHDGYCPASAKIFGNSSVIVGTQGLFRPYLKTFVTPFLPTRLTARESPRMGSPIQCTVAICNNHRTL